MPPSPTMFDQAVAAHSELMREPPVTPDAFMASVNAVETAGTIALEAKGVGKLSIQAFGEAMLGAIGVVEGRKDIKPPLGRGQKALLAGKLTTYAQLAVVEVEGTAVPTDAGPGTTTNPKP